MKILTFVLSFTLCFHSVMAQTIDGNNSLDSTFAETTQLTDAQADEAANFVHQGLKDKAIEKGCDNKTLKGCDQTQPDKMGVVFGGAIENQIGKFYAIIFGALPMFTKKKGGNDPAPTESGAANDAKPEKKKSDYCIYIPMAYEGISMLTQMAGQKQAQQDTQNLDPQLSSLVQLKEAHKTRKKTATQQSVVYGSTAACYAAMLLMGKVDGGAMTFVKMGAAGALSTLFMAKAKKHANAAKLVQGVIDSLPKAGDCNPWTGSACFCAEKTSSKLYPGQYQEVCVLNKGNFEGELANMGCATQTNGQMSLDKDCTCKATNTCFNSKITLSGSQLGLGANFVNDANKGLELLDPSQFDGAKLADFQSSMAAKLKGIKSNERIPDVKLTPEQKALADEMSKVAPASVAAIAAASPAGAPPTGGLMSGSTSGLDKIPEALKKEMEDFRVSGKYKKNGGFSPTASDPEIGFSIPGMGTQEPQGGIKYEEEFAAKAVNNADVRNTPETPIFDIISNRYRASGWKRLESSEKK